MTIRAISISAEIDGIPLLSDMSLEIVPGEVLALVGPNGAGKSTLLSVLAGDLNPVQGSIFYNKRNIAQLDVQERAHYRSVMSQALPMVFDFSVKDIVEMGWLHNGQHFYSDHFKSAVQQIVDQCNISSLINRRFNTLSGGEQKRVHFARALLQLWKYEDSLEAKYLMLDEPLANLDIRHELSLLAVIRKAAASGIGVLIILHDLNLAAKFADKVAMLNQGRIVGLGVPEDVLTTQLLTSVYDVPINVKPNPLTISYY
ncbi:MAG: heme ABC transporter ATP-binding protein [Porticoccaceae bacterium]|jgi:iron complex transport system ATP-binding protein|tara:strand:- start:825 stop:1598 length:774 start_codon:yes stop_codon:yes gene_type:complete